MDGRRIARADIYFCGGLVAAILGSLLHVRFSGPTQLVWLGVIMFIAPMVGTLAALLISGRSITSAPFLWALVGGVGAALLGLASVFIVYDLLLIIVAVIATVGFLPLLAIAAWRDRRRWTLAVRLLVIPTTVLLLILQSMGSGPAEVQPVGVWLAATWPIAGAALLAPVPWRLGPRLTEDADASVVV